MIERLDGPSFQLWLDGDQTTVRRLSFSELSGPAGRLDWITPALSAYLAGRGTHFPGALSFDEDGQPIWTTTPHASLPQTPLGLLYQAMATVPYGQTVSYGQLAELTGHPRWARAAGQACRLNPIPLLLPCHRIVAAQGLGGYSPGLELKRILLRLERLSA